MNVRESATIRAPSGKDEACIKFIIDTPDTPFVLHEIAQIGMDYTLSFYAKSEASGGITAGGISTDTSSEWQRYVITFSAESDDVPLYFNATGTYYIHKIQLEEGNKDTTWALAPDDEEERLTDAITRITANESSIELMVSTQESFSGRLTTTESQLSVLQENIDLRVKYTDLDAYSTTAQMEAAINVSANSITQTVSETYATKENTEASITEVKTIATQTAEKFNWLVASGDSSASFTLTERMAELIADTISLNGNVKVNGDMLVDGSITANKIDVADLFAQNITASGSITGVMLNGATGSFSGNVTATTGTIGSWEFNEKSIRNKFVSGVADIGRTGMSIGINTDTGELDAKTGLVFWAGAPWNSTPTTGFGTLLSSAPFRVYADGGLYADKATVKGDISADNITVTSTLKMYSPMNLKTGPILSYDTDGSGILYIGGTPSNTFSAAVTICAPLHASYDLNVHGVFYTNGNDAYIAGFYLSGTRILGSSGIVISNDVVQVGLHGTESKFRPQMANDGAVELGDTGARWKKVYAVSNTIGTSDERDKDIIGEFGERHRNLFMALKPIEFRWRDKNIDEAIHFGLGAQTTEQSAIVCGFGQDTLGAIEHGRWTEPNKDGRTDRYGISYAEISMLAIPVVQDHEHRLTNTESQIEILQYRLDQAYDEIAKLKQQLAS